MIILPISKDAAFLVFENNVKDIFSHLNFHFFPAI